MHEGLGLEQGLGFGNTYGLSLGLWVKIVRSRVEGLGLGKVMHEGLGLENGLGFADTYPLGFLSVFWYPKVTFFSGSPLY